MDITVDEDIVAAVQADHRRARRDRRAGQQRRVRHVRGDGGHHAGRRPVPVRGETCFGLARLTQLALPHMRAEGRRQDREHLLGRRQRSTPRSVPGTTPRSTLSKAGPTGLRLELKPFGIDCDRHRARHNPDRVR